MSEERLNANDLEGLQAENGWLRKTENNHHEESIWTTQDKCLSLECPEKNLGQSRKKRKFREGLDVLCRWTDGLLYLGVIIKVEEKLKKALVRFEDSSEYWTLFKDMQRGNMSGGEIVCVKCENGQSDPPNEIVICDHCNLGYHQHCHRPKISSEVLKPEVPWYCRSCIFASTAKKGGAVKKGLYGQVMQQMKMTLPYDLYTLTWDAQHKFNSEQCYCYCGGPGEWYLKMLQCCRCKQWFHEACLQCLDFPLLYGDRFYIFVCSVCKGGPEFISRLALKCTTHFSMKKNCMKSFDSSNDSSTSTNGQKLMRCSMEAMNRKRKIPRSNSSRSRYSKNSGQCLTIKQNISDSDDASSRNTLDTIIPPPTNFEGINHPFRELDQPLSSSPQSQPMKNQLNEDDFQDFRNGEFIKKVKRRRKRENNTKKTWVNLCGNKRLAIDNGLENSLVSISKNLNLSPENLYTSVSNYLGSTNRITRGEKFRVLARRVTLEGIVQYLIEWGGTPT
ncbi:metal-response element-binding transcription factor 2-like [Limulus polyphemus]|uniref:Metal-response element-binding transcription factor 2-like n=1 Tax=Limulus polyphemus TaxID=6850 RepID=A0ABM1T490_LIMPO|nr:metal-response element-binding transcription factor 2-like [Limulus polyphemus]